MSSFFKWISLISIMLFSFYYTEKIALYMQKENPLRQTIEKNKKDYSTTSVNAVVDGNYIIPGLNGEIVNVDKSFINMKSFKTFNKYYLVYDILKPSITLDNNLDKIIKYGNPNKKSVSIVIENNNTHKNYFISANTKINLLTFKDDFSKDSFFEQINNDVDNYKDLDNLLNKYNLNKKICIVSNQIIDYCENNKYYLIDYSIKLNNSNIIDVKKNLKSGSIIYIDENTNLDYIKLLVKYIINQGLTIMVLSDLIKE